MNPGLDAQVEGHQAGGFPDGVRVEKGIITMPELPGIGFEGKSDLYKEMKALAA